MHKSADKLGTMNEYPMNSQMNSSVNKNVDTMNFTLSTSFFTFINTSYTVAALQENLILSHETSLYTY